MQKVVAVKKAMDNLLDSLQDWTEYLILVLPSPPFAEKQMSGPCYFQTRRCDFPMMANDSKFASHQGKIIDSISSCDHQRHGSFWELHESGASTEFSPDLHTNLLQSKGQYQRISELGGLEAVSH
jgi:hypothetical protein